MAIDFWTFLNGFYFCPKLARNYNIVPFETLKVIIVMKDYL